MSQRKKPALGLRRLSLLWIAIFVLMVGALALIMYNGVGMQGLGQMSETAREQAAMLPLSSGETTTSISILPTDHPPFVDEASLEPPTTTPAPVPTWTPTPVTTPIPLAKAPFITDLPDNTVPYTLLLRDGQVLSLLDRKNLKEREVIDVQARTSLFLAERQDGIMPFEWGAASPVEGKIALVLVDRSTQQGMPSRFSIHLLDLESGKLTLLVEDGLLPAWSPDGSSIAYRSVFIDEVPHDLIDGERTVLGTRQVLREELRVVDVTTKNITTLFSLNPDVENSIDRIQWSPKGDRIAFIKTHNDLWNTGAIFTVSAAGQEEATEIATMETDAGSIRWSTDGKRIAFTFDESIWVIDVASHEQTNLHSTKYMTISGGQPVWVSDSQQLVFAGVKRFEQETNPSYDLWLVDAQNNNLQRLTLTNTVTTYPEWIVDSNKILFQKDGKGIWELDLNSGEQIQIYPKEVEYSIVLQPATTDDAEMYTSEAGGYSFRYPSSHIVTFPNSAPPWVVQLRPASDSVTEATITLFYLTPGIEEGQDLSEWARTYHSIGPAAYEDMLFFPFDLAHANLPEGSQQIYVASKEGAPHPFHAYYITHGKLVFSVSMQAAVTEERAVLLRQVAESITFSKDAPLNTAQLASDSAAAPEVATPLPPQQQPTQPAPNPLFISPVTVPSASVPSVTEPQRTVQKITEWSTFTHVSGVSIEYPTGWTVEQFSWASNDTVD
ncbi:hypothetical protein GC175_08770, partial [bacterium]|nr:hypothetical protein [bacterium]